MFRFDQGKSAVSSGETGRACRPRLFRGREAALCPLFGAQVLLPLLFLVSGVSPLAAQTPSTEKKPGLEVAPEVRKVSPSSETPAPPPSLDSSSKVEEKPAASPANKKSTTPSQKSTAPAAAAQKTSKPSTPVHQKGRAPRIPADSLPPGAPLSQADEAARRAVAEGPSREAQQAGAPDPELISLRDAESALFPTYVRGIQPGWSWDLPERREEGGVLGLPLLSAVSVQGTELPEADSEWIRSLTLPDLPVRLDRRVVTYLKFYRDSPRGRTIAAIWAKKSGRYISAMKAEMRRAGLPTDLVWLSMIESGHNPTIASPAGAVGLWQFMPASGRMYGLTVDRWVDERRDPARSTQAAIRMLSDLKERFGNWELAMAAYNMGYAGLSRSISKYNTNDYWALSRLESGIPWETTLYVPKIFALAIVMNNRESFGLGKIQSDPPVSFDTILVEPATPLTEIARAAGCSVEEIEELNPAFLAGRLPPATEESSAFSVRIPVGKGAQAARSLEAKKKTKRETIVSRWGDSWATLAQEYGVSEAVWLQHNQLGKKERLLPGTVLFLPPGAKKKEVPGPESFVVSRALRPTEKQKLVFYEVRAGDDLEELASALQVPARDLIRWNSLDPVARLREGMLLQLLVPVEQQFSTVRVLPQKDAQLLVAGSPDFHEYFESLGGKQRLSIVVQAGDTLAKIGQKYGMSVGSMERVNRKSRSSALVPGETVIVYTNRPGTSAPDTGGRAPLEEIAAPRPDLLPESTAQSSP